MLLIVVDTLRADYVGAYGADVHTPNIDALAAAGVRFSDARSHIPITGPSHASLFTSLLPMEHGVLNNAQIMGEGFPTLAEALQTAGRRTAGVISLGVMQGEFGFERGFDLYGDEFPRDWLKDAGEVTDEALTLADGSFREPYFLWVHYSDPHEPYAPTNEEYPVFNLRLDGRSIGWIDAGGRGFRFDLEVPAGDSVLEFVPMGEGEPGRVYRVDNLLLDEPSIEIEALDGWHVIPRRMGRTTYESEFPATVRLTNPSGSPVRTGMLVSCKKLLHKPEIREAYAGETEFVDLQIGRLLAGLDARGLMDNTLVVFASDHGEGLGDHNHVGHISQVYDSLLDVPLIMTWPGRLPAGKVIDAPVGLVDLFPTVADLLGLESPPDTSGVSLVPLIRDEAVAERAVIAATYRPESFSDKRAIVLDGFKYIQSWKDDREWEELYDVSADPGELEDLAEVRPEIVDRLRTELARRLAAMNENAPVEVELSEEDRAHLRALGYIH
jgi:arylsulfatase A-like enzyme